MCFALVAPPVDFAPGVILGLAVLYGALHDTIDWRAAFARGWYWAFGAGLVGLRFVPDVVERFTPVGYWGGLAALALLSAFQATGWGLAAVVQHLARGRVGVDRRLAFGLAVFIAASLPGVFVWTPAGVLGAWPESLQLAEYVGERGVSVLLALAAALIAEPLLPPREGAWKKRLVPLLGGVGLLGALWLHGAWRLQQLERSSSQRPTLRVGVIQGAVGARTRWQPNARGEILYRLRGLTRRAERQGAEVVVWPEAAYPYVLPHRAGPAPAGATAVVRPPVRGPVLTGALTRSLEEKGQHNAALVIQREGVASKPQAKIELLWFGERLPLGHQLPWLRQIFYRAGGLLPGNEVVLQPLPRGAQAAVLNCYEDTLPGLGRRMASKQPQLLVNITNDGWFADTIEPELHLRLSVLRAIETRLDLVRAVNLGVPALIDARGVIVERGPINKRGVMLVDAGLATKERTPTLFVKAGDYPLWGFFLLVTVGGFLRRRSLVERGEKGPPDVPPQQGRKATEPGP